jgi:cytoskeleton protein RodZ
VVEEYQAPLGDVFDMPAPSVGERLRRARTVKRLELADLARDTRIPHRHLAAIEADSHESLPALTYTIGFVRTFARAVGLPEDEIAAQFKAETTKTAHVPQTMPLEPVDEARLPSRGVVAAGTAAMIIVVAGIWAWGAGWFQSDPPPVAEVAQIEPATTPAVDPIAQASAAPLVSGDTPVSSTGDIGVAPAAQAGATADIAGAAQPVAGGPVVITATEDAWIKVYDSAERKTVKMGILAPGESYVVPADRNDLLLWTGRAGALKVTVGGRPVPPLGGARDTVQDVSLAPAALLARAG